MEYDEGKKSVFNAGIAQTERIDALQRAINSSRFNLLMRNAETGTFNYEVMISANDALFHEAWAKLSEKEKERGERIRTLITGWIKYSPPIKANRRGELIINQESYENLVKLLDQYEKINKELLDAHNLNSPNAEEEGFF